MDARVDAVVDIHSLCVADSPRLAGLNEDHVRSLSDAVDGFPPIVLHRDTMNVIDGVHRLEAALSQGQSSIEVSYFDGDAADAFVFAVQANIKHGLPLTRAERTAAAARIVGSHPHWSDRRIAANTGLSPKTVGAIRRRSSEDIPQPAVRIGLDGRRRRIGGVRDVPAQRGVAGEQPEPEATAQPTSAQHGQQATTSAVGKYQHASHADLIHSLRRDPSLRFSDAGRALLRLLDLHLLDTPDWDRLAANVPAHRTSQIASAARECAQVWKAFAERLQHFEGQSVPVPTQRQPICDKRLESVRKSD